MFYTLSWLGVFCLLALWSFAAWAFHAVAAWTVSNTGALLGGSLLTQGLRVPEWLASWVPPELPAALTSTLGAFTPAVQAMLGWAPSSAGGLSVTVWVVWAIGSALLVVLGVALTAVIAVLRRGLMNSAVRSEFRQPRVDRPAGKVLGPNLQ